MALINEIKIIETEKKIWNDRNAFVFSDTGIWRYSLEHRNEKEFNSPWVDDADYIDNVRSDFLNEAGEDGNDIYSTELFDRVADVLFLDEDTRYFHYKGQRAFIDYEEMLPELLEKEMIIVVTG